MSHLSLHNNTSAPLSARRTLTELAWAVLPALGLLIYDLARGELLRLQPDAQLYLSVADNFLSTGHFLQNVRAAGSFVVPPGLPVILTLLRLAGLGPGGIAAVQYALFALSCFLLRRTEEALFGRPGISPAVYALALFRARLTLGNVFVEHFFLPVLCAILYTAARRDLAPGKRLLRLHLLTLLAAALRPVLAVLYVPVLIYTFSVLRKGAASRRVLWLLLLPCLLWGANAAVNHRETGHWIAAENYAGEDMYLANNPGTRTELYEYENRTLFLGGDESALAAYDDPDPTVRDAALRTAALRWIAGHPGAFCRNTAVKFLRLFGLYWLGGFFLSLAAGVWLAGKSKNRVLLRTAVGTALALALVTSAGLAVGRYSIVVWPLSSVLLSVTAVRLFRKN